MSCGECQNAASLGDNIRSEQNKDDKESQWKGQNFKAIAKPLSNEYGPMVGILESFSHIARQVK